MKEKRFFSLILPLILVLCMAAALCGCGRASDAGSGEDYVNTYLVYYSNADANDIIYREYNGISAASTSYEIVEELCYQMFDAASEYDGYYSAKPDSVTKNGQIIDENGVLTIDFSSEYNSLTNVQEIILRAAVVLTVIQIDAVKEVVFTVDGEPALNSSGEEIGSMTADNFVSVLVTEDGMLAYDTNLTIYFANEDGTALVPVTVNFSTVSNNMSGEEYILQCLIAGPDEEDALAGACAVMTADVEVLSVTTSSDGICYVNFSSTFLNQEGQPVSDELMVYAIVDSLCRLSYVSGVQFLVDGESNVTTLSLMDLSQPLAFNWSYIGSS